MIELMTVLDHPLIVKNIVWHSEADTAAFAAVLARQPGLAHAVVELHGDMGTGKTTFTRYLLGALGVQGRVKSPTYAVVEPYTIPSPFVAVDGPASAELAIWHFDFYRFSDPQEWEDAGFRDIFASDGLKLVEWPEQAGAHLPPADLRIELTLGSQGQRDVNLQAFSALGKALLP